MKFVISEVLSTKKNDFGWYRHKLLLSNNTYQDITKTVCTASSVPPEVGSNVDHTVTEMPVRLHKRLSNIGVDIQMLANYPWIYLSSINGKTVTEKLGSQDGFTIILTNPKYHFTDRREVFKLIRKYVTR